MGATWAAGLLRAAGATWLAGAAVKVVDGAVDGEPGWDPAAAAAYGAALLAAAAALQPAWTASLVAAAWAVGMLRGYGGRGLAEGAALAALVGAAAGWRELAGALLAVAAVQAADRVEDREGWPAGRGPGGRLAAAAGALILAAAAAGVDPLKAGLALALVPACESLAAWVGRRRPAPWEASWTWSG